MSEVRKESSVEERRLDSYYRVHVPWVDEDGGVNTYFADHIHVEDHWVRFTAEGWLWSKERDGANHTEYFDTPQCMAIPRNGVEVVYWPDGVYAQGLNPNPAESW